MTIKTCRKCGCDKPLEDFYNHTRTKDGKRAECKEYQRVIHQSWVENNRDKARQHSLKHQSENKAKCKAKQQKWLKAHPEKQYEYRLKNRYGMSLTEYRQMVDQQDGKCAICGQVAPQN